MNNINLDEIMATVKEQAAKKIGENKVKATIMFLLGEDRTISTSFGSSKDILKLTCHIQEQNMLEEIKKESLNACLEKLEGMPSLLKKMLQEMVNSMFKDIQKPDETEINEIDKKNDSSEVA